MTFRIPGPLVAFACLAVCAVTAGAIVKELPELIRYLKVEAM